jgi:UDP-N-acetylglucosamine 2-epimerase (non-hydrolysing)
MVAQRKPLVAVIVGIRSQYIKLAAVQSALDLTEVFDCVYVDTGQHYDGVLAEQYVDEYTLHFDYRLHSGSSERTPVETLANMLVATETTLAERSPDGVLVFGDANSTLAGGLAARRLGIPIAHLEAGVRTGEDTPEELNRIIIDRVASLHMASTERDLAQLQQEGHGDTSVFLGDVVRDLCGDVESESLGERYGLITIHRAENTRDASVLLDAVDALEGVGLKPVVVFHPRVLRLVQAETPQLLDRVVALESVSHARILRLMKGAEVVVTDSGALQRESYYLGRRAVVVQDQPFWPSLIDAGFNVGVAPSGDIRSATRVALGPPPEGVREFGDPGVSSRVADAVGVWLGSL